MSIKIFSYYIVRPYSFFLENNSANLILNCIKEVEIFIDGILLAGLEFLAEMILISFLVILLFFINPIASITVTVVALILFFIFQVFSRDKMQNWSKIRQNNETKIIEKIQQGYNGLKEIIVFMKERFL